jgi:hypothetical protein
MKDKQYIEQKWLLVWIEERVAQVLEIGERKRHCLRESEQERKRLKERNR